MKHTKGPWQITGYKNPRGKFFTYQISPTYADGMLLADVWGVDHLKGECRANAYLIAAAPDLLDALEAIIACATGEAGFTLPMQFALDRGYQALAKLKGQRACVECGKEFNPKDQGDEEDVSCMDCIDSRNFKEE